MAREMSIELRRKKLALEYTTRISACKNHTVHRLIFNNCLNNTLKVSLTRSVFENIRSPDLGMDISFIHILSKEELLTTPWANTQLNIRLEQAKNLKQSTPPAIFCHMFKRAQRKFTAAQNIH